MKRLVPVLAVLLAACDDGTLHLSVADAPVDGAERVVVRFDRVTLERDGGETETFEFSPPKSIDLLALTQGDAAPLLSGERVEAARYRAVILGVSAVGDGTDSFVESGGARRGLLLADVDEGRLRIAAPFDVERRGETALTVDFDLRKSIRTPASDADPYALVPTLRLVDDEKAGTLFGDVDAELVPTGCAPAVYVYSGHDAVPDDEGSAAAPRASGIVRPSATAFSYTVAWLDAGDYTAALTCEAAADEADQDDATTFLQQANVTIDEGEATALDFPPP